LGEIKGRTYFIKRFRKFQRAVPSKERASKIKEGNEELPEGNQQLI
jgi:hypothetical protein